MSPWEERSFRRNTDAFHVWHVIPAHRERLVCGEHLLMCLDNLWSGSLYWAVLLRHLMKKMMNFAIGHDFQRKAALCPFSELIRSTTHLCVKVWTPLVHIQIKHSGASEDAQSCDWSPSVPPLNLHVWLACYGGSVLLKTTGSVWTSSFILGPLLSCLAVVASFHMFWIFCPPGDSPLCLSLIVSFLCEWLELCPLVC